MTGLSEKEIQDTKILTIIAYGADAPFFFVICHCEARSGEISKNLAPEAISGSMITIHKIASCI